MTIDVGPLQAFHIPQAVPFDIQPPAFIPFSRSPVAGLSTMFSSNLVALTLYTLPAFTASSPFANSKAQTPLL